jgi:protoheme IX farnesyltransferase
VKHMPASSVPVTLAPVRAARAADYLALTKPRLNLLVIATSAAGYYLGAPGKPDLAQMTVAVAGTALVAGSAAVLNQVYERNTDALMRRTRMRPLPDGRVTPGEAKIFGVVLAAAGLALLAACTNVLAFVAAAATLIVYLHVYTPLKRRSPLATLVGAIPGGLPPLIGWAASHHTLSWGGAALFAIVFLWQIPHFMAIAWLYRDDYGKAGFPMLPVIEPDGARTGRHAVAYAAILLPVSLAPAAIRLSGTTYAAVAAVLGAILLGLAFRFAQSRNDSSARRLFVGSIIYLPLIWIAMILDKL